MSDRPTLTRRGFLRTTAVAAAVAPVVVPASALGRDEQAAASERVVIGYLGTGPRGMVNIREQLTCADAQVVAVCDVWQHVRDRAKQTIDAKYKNSDCKTYVDFREVIGRDDIDAVGIASPDHWHVPMAIAAVKAGKDVSVEKPLGISLAQDQLCREAVKRYDRVFQYGTEARAAAACRFGCELVRNGRIGEIREIRVKSPNSRPGGSRDPKPVPEGLNYGLWLGPAPWRPYSGCPNNGPSWYHVRDYALGFIAGWAAHPLDLLQWAYDTHLTGPWEVEGTGLIDTKGCNDAVCDWNVDFQFDNGVKMKFFAVGVETEEDPLLAKLGNYAQLIGTEGWIAVYYANMMCEPELLADKPLGPSDVRLPISKGQERNFIECVRTRRTPVAHIDDAVRSDTISHISDIAIRAGRKIQWDPAKEQIMGDPEAARMLTRAMRDPWQL